MFCPQDAKQRLKPSLCVFLALLLLAATLTVWLFPARADYDWRQTATQTDITANIEILKTQYPEGMKWTNQDPTPAYVWKLPGTVISMGGCASFAAIIQDSIFGSIKETPVTWQRISTDCTTSGIPQNEIPYSWDNLWPGDILDFTGHTVIVTKKFSDHVIIAEGNYGGKIHWGREITKQGVKAAKYVLTRYKKTELLMPYLDLPDRAHWSWTPISWVLLNQYADPVSPLTFEPKSECTRAAMITALWRACGAPEPQTGDRPFTDLSEEMACYKAVYWAFENGITVGTSQTSFSPNGTCTRAQALTMLWRAAGSPENRNGKKTFDDVDSTDYFFRTVNWATEYEITKGTSETTFSPKKTCSRAEAIGFLYEAAQNGQLNK